MTARRPRGWGKAEGMYGELCADRMMPLLQGPLSPAQVVERLQEIMAACGRFYPAALELGLRTLLSGDPADGERLVGEGFDLLLELADPDHRTDEVLTVVENLERLHRFDCSARLLETMVRREPLSADLHDSLAHALARSGRLEAAAREISEAVRLAPLDPNHRSNQGWIDLLAGNLAQARAALEAAAELDRDHQAVRGNLEVLGYLEAHGGTYLDYLLRPPDLARIESLADDEQWEAVDELCADYNGGRLDAMVLAAMEGEETQRRRIPDLIATLTTFFRFVREVREDAYHLNEDIGWLTDHFQPLMHKFIFRHRDADPQMIEEICAALLELTDFLAARGLVSSADRRTFRSKLRTLKPGLIRKTTRYGQIRKDRSLSEAERERVQDELFDGDQWWPTL